MATDQEALLLQYGVQLDSLQKQMDRAVGVVSDGGARMVLKSKAAMAEVEKAYGSVDAKGFADTLKKTADLQDRLRAAQQQSNTAEAKALREQLVLQQAVQKAQTAQLETQLAIAKATGAKGQATELAEVLAVQQQLGKLQSVGLTGARALHEAEAAVIALSSAEKAAEGVNLGRALDQVFDRSRLAVLEEGSAKIPLFGSAIEALGPAGLAAAGALAAVGVAAESARQSMEWADDLDRTAKHLGVTTTGLQQLDYAAVASSIGLEKGREALGQFNEMIGKFETHTGDVRLVKWANAIKLTRAEANQTIDPVEKLQLVLEKIAALPDAQSRAAAAKSFGLDQLLPLINEGSEGIEKFIGKMREARENGSIVDPREIAQAAELNDKVDELTYRIGVDFKKAFIDVAPAIETVAEFIERCTHALSDFLGQIPAAVRGVQELIDKLPHLPTGVHVSQTLKDAAGNATLDLLPGGRQAAGLLHAGEGAIRNLVANGQAAQLGDKVRNLLGGGKVDLTGSDFDPALARQGAGRQLNFDKPKKGPADETLNFDKAANDAYESALKELTQAQLALTGDIEARAAAEKATVDADLAKKTNAAGTGSLDVEEKKIREAMQKGLDARGREQLALIDKARTEEQDAATAKKQLIDRNAGWAVEDQIDETRRQLAAAAIAQLQAQADLAATARERTAIERQILDIRQKELIHETGKTLSRLVETGALGQDAADQRNQALLDANAAQRQQFARAHGTPVENYLRSIQDLDTEMQNAAVAAAQDLSRGLADAIVNAKSLGDVARSVFRNLVTQLLSAAIQKDIAAPLLHLIPGFAGGTDFAPGGVALVGEHGPELVNLPRGTQVTPTFQTLAALNGLSAARAAGVTVIQPLHFHAEGAVLTDQLLAQANAHANKAAAQAGQWARSAARQDSQQASYSANLNR